MPAKVIFTGDPGTPSLSWLIESRIGCGISILLGRMLIFRLVLVLVNPRCCFGNYGVSYIILILGISYLFTEVILTSVNLGLTSAAIVVDLCLPEY